MSTERQAGDLRDRPSTSPDGRARSDLVRWSTSTPLIAVGAVALGGWLLDRVVGQYNGLGIGHGPLNGFYWPASFVVLAIGLSLWQQRNGLGTEMKGGFGSWLLAGGAAVLLLFAFLSTAVGPYIGAGVLLLVCGLRQRDRLLGWIGAALLLMTLVEHAVIRPMLPPAVIDAGSTAEPDFAVVNDGGAWSEASQVFVISYLAAAVLILGLGVATRLFAKRGAPSGGEVPVTAPVTERAWAAELLGTLGNVRTRVRADRRATSTPLLVFGAVVLVGSSLQLLLRPTENLDLLTAELPAWIWILDGYWGASLLAAVVGLWWWQRRQLARLGVGPGVGFGLPVVLVLLNQLSWLQWLPPLAGYSLPAFQVSYLFNPLVVVGATLWVAGARQRNRVLCWWGVGMTGLGILDSVAWLVNSSNDPASVLSVADVIGRVETLTYVVVGVALLVAGGVARWRRS